MKIHFYPGIMLYIHIACKIIIDPSIRSIFTKETYIEYELMCNEYTADKRLGAIDDAIARVTHNPDALIDKIHVPDVLKAMRLKKL